MKPADRPAGDRHEQKRHDRRSPHGRGLHGGRHDRHAALPQKRRRPDPRDDQHQPQQKLIAVHIVPRLEQQPDRQHAGEVAIDKECERPGDDRADGDPAERERGNRKLEEVELRRQHHGGNHDDQRHQRRQVRAEPPLVDQHADNDGHRHRDPHRQHARRIGRKDAGDHQPEDGQHDRQRQKENQQKQNLDTRIDEPTRHLTDRLPPVADRDHQRPKVMNRPDEDAAKEHPQQCRHPAPDDRQRRSHNRPRPGDGRKVMAEQDRLASRHKVLPVGKLFARHRRIGIKPEELPRKPSPVGVVGDQIENKAADGNKEGGHDPCIVT